MYINLHLYTYQYIVLCKSVCKYENNYYMYQHCVYALTSVWKRIQSSRIISFFVYIEKVIPPGIFFIIEKAAPTSSINFQRWNKTIAEIFSLVIFLISNADDDKFTFHYFGFNTLSINHILGSCGFNIIALVTRYCVFFPILLRILISFIILLFFQFCFIFNRILLDT